MKSARTPLFRQVRAVLQQSMPEDALLGRRRFLRLTGASALLAGLGTQSSLLHAAEKGPVAIVGAGAAGLTAAYRLMQAGREVHLFEASERVGGRMFTKRDFNTDGQFVELGGELLDTNHTDILDLAKELGLETQNLLEGEKGEDIFYFEGETRRHEEVLEAFKPLGAIIAADVEKMYDEQDNFTEYATTLDSVSMEDYLKKAVDTTEAWVIQLIIAAYEPEYGLEVAKMSCLNLVDFIDPDTSDGFHIFGDSNEALRIKGGNSSLPEALAKALEGKISLHTGSKLAKICESENGITLTISSKDEMKESTWPRVVLALPFTQLRKVEGIFELSMSEEKKKAIKELGYGMNVKVMHGFKDRYWRKPTDQRDYIANGSVFAEEPTYQNVWETSRGQDGEAGIITNLLGAKRGINYSAEAMKPYLDELDKALPGAKDSHDGNTAVMNWPKMPFSEGSYSCPLVGQYTWISDASAATECGGKLLFVGEHTSFVSAGFMNGAVESGNRAAAELLG